MFKFLKKPKFLKIISFILVMMFTINVTGCGNNNGIDVSVKNRKVGMGSNTVGYTVYTESTFDPMTRDLFMGYLLNGREFTLVVVPGNTITEDDPKTHEHEGEYEINDAENYLFKAAQVGIQKYDEKTASFVEPNKKLLMYYVTDDELVDWFEYFDKMDTFMNDALNFMKGTHDLEDPSGYKCENLVNRGSGLNAKDFCKHKIKNDPNDEDKAEIEENIFTNDKTGGMILLFGYGSIEGYLTYKDINDYTGSAVANSLVSTNCPLTGCYNPSNVTAFDFKSILYSDFDKNELSVIGKTLTKSIDDGGDYEYSISDVYNFAVTNTTSNDNLRVDTVYLATEAKVHSSAPGYETFKATYELMGSAIITDYAQEAGTSNLSELKTYFYNKKSEGEKYDGLYQMTSMLVDDFDKYAKEEAFNIKMAAALYSRYSTVYDYSDTSVLNSNKTYSSLENLDDDDYPIVQSLVKGKGSSKSNNTYLLVVTADGFVLDRGSEEDQISAGASDMMGMSEMLANLIRMDACPNETIAAQMYNMFANFKIVAGTALAVAGVTAFTVAAVGLTVAGVIAKLAAVGACAPVPGGRIAALVCLAIAGLIALGVGLLTLFSGLKDKARLKGLGASETNYCETYVATFNLLFETLALTVPVYHYEVPQDDTDANQGLALNYCEVEGEVYFFDAANPSESGCYEYKDGIKTYKRKAIPIPLYYYASREKSRELDLVGAPAVMYFNNGSYVDGIWGAATPSYIVEALRFWGLLSMRELVYKSEIYGGKINVYHTTNTNARTMEIMEAKYCYTLKYNQDLYGALGENDFCYQADGTEGVATKSINEGYESGKKQNVFEADLPSDNLKTVVAGIDVYSIYYSQTAGYKFNEYSISHEVTKLSTPENLENVTIDTVAKKITSKDLNGEIVKEIVYDKSYDNEIQYYYLVNNGDGTTSVYYSNEAAGKTISKIATYKGDISDFSVDKNNGTKDKYTTIDFLRYLQGDLKFDVKQDVIPIYFTATIKESPQADYYLKSNGKKETCDTGEYMYYRDNKMWFDNKSKCLSDDDVKSKDSPYKTIDFDSSDVRYYSTSIQVGTIQVKIDDAGVTTVTVTWNS